MAWASRVQVTPSRKGVEADGEWADSLLDQVVGEERDERKGKEEEEIGPEDEGIDVLEAVDERVVVDPVKAGEEERKQIHGDGGENGEEAGKSVGVRDL
jgi:hypothetical protein